MKSKYLVRYSPIFYQDLENIIDYISRVLCNPVAARSLLEEVRIEIDKRANKFVQHQKYISTKKRKQAYYKMYVKNYIIFYVIEDNIMEVRRMLYSRRNIVKYI